MKGHKYGVYCIVLNYSNKYLYSGSADNTIGIWGCKSRKKERSLDGHNATVVSLIKSKNEQFLFSIGKDNLIIVWSLTKYEILNKIPGFSASNTTKCFCLSDQFYTIFGRDKKEKGRLRAVNLMSGETVKLLKLHTKSIRCMELDTDNEMLFTGGFDGVINILKVEDTAVIKKLKHHKFPINCLTSSEDGTFLASASDDKTTKIFKVKNDFELIYTFNHDIEVSSILFSNSNKRLITGGWHFKPIKIWYIGDLNIAPSKIKVNTPGQFFMAASPINWKDEDEKTTHQKVKEKVLTFAKGLEEDHDLFMTKKALNTLDKLESLTVGVDPNFKDEQGANKILQGAQIDIQELSDTEDQQEDIERLEKNFEKRLTLVSQEKDLELLEYLQQGDYDIPSKSVSYLNNSIPESSRGLKFFKNVDMFNDKEFLKSKTVDDRKPGLPMRISVINKYGIRTPGMRTPDRTTPGTRTPAPRTPNRRTPDKKFVSSRNFKKVPRKKPKLVIK